MVDASNQVIEANQCVDLVPIVIAVTGHRAFPDCVRSPLERAVGDLIVTLREQFPHTPLRMLSGLAEGADRLAAKVAITHGVELIAVLPMTVNVYEHDFSTDESRAEFHKLLSMAAGVIVTDQGPSPQADSPGRESVYVRQGAYLVHNCDLLVAFWDGGEPEGYGGTANIVKFRLEGVPQELAPARSLFDKRTGPVYHIDTPRDASSSSRTTAGSARLLIPPAGSRVALTATELNRRFAGVEFLNRDLRAQPAPVGPLALPMPSAACLASMIPDERQLLEHLRRRFDAADRLAVRFQAQTWRLFKAMLVCSVASLVCLQLHAASHNSSGPFLALYVVLLLAAYGLFGLSKQNRYESRAFDYRAIAEGVRIQYFWRLAGLEECVADHYLGRQQGVLNWIRRALRIWVSDGRPRRSDRSVTPESLDFLLVHWIRDQLRFFSGTAEKQRLLQTRLGRLANGLVFLGVMLAALKLLTSATAWWTSLAAVPPFIAAALLAYGNTRALSEQVNQYESMRELYAVAEEQLLACLASGDIAAGQHLALELGKEALAENADWLILHRRRPVSSPTVGS